MKLPTGTPRALISSIALYLAGSALAQPTITEMPLLPGTFTRSWAMAVSADGQVIVGCSAVSSNGYDTIANPQAVRWTSAGLQNLTGTRFGAAYATNQDGTAVAGFSGDGPFRWTAINGLLLLPQAAGLGTNASARGMSRDGTVVGGSNWSLPFRWTGSSGTQVLSAPSLFTNGDLSGNGQVLVGWSGTTGEALRFVGSGAAQVVSPNAQAWGVNADGRVVLGMSYDLAKHAARWDYPSVGSQLPPTVTDLGIIQGPFQELCTAYSTAISDDGLTIVGSGTRYAEGVSPTQFPKSAFIWRPELGLVDLNLYLPSQGLDLTGWHLRLAEDISADGRVIVGQAIRNGLVRGFVLRLPPWCSTADFNNDGDFGTDTDIEAFFACLAGNCCPTCWRLGSDFNADGDAGTDADIEAFFRVLAGQAC